LSRHDSIKAPAINALGTFGDKGALPALQEVFFNKALNLNIRMKAAWALGQIFNRDKVKMPTEDVEKTMAVLEEPAPKETIESEQQMKEFRQMIFTLLGQANLSAQDSRLVSNFYRPHRQISSEEPVNEEPIDEEPEEEERTEEPEERTKSEDDGWEDDEDDWDTDSDDDSDDSDDSDSDDDDSDSDDDDSDDSDDDTEGDEEEDVWENEREDDDDDEDYR